jgi:hypothetical protein
MVGIVLAFMANESIICTFAIFPPAVHTARMLNTILCIPLIHFVVKHYKDQLEVMKLNKEIYHKTTLMQSPLRNSVLIECFINCLHLPAGPEIVYELKAVNYPYQMALDYYFTVTNFFLIQKRSLCS